ncbi:MAG: hypothetical protein RXN93_06660 [Thermocladium sp.]
MDEQNKQMGTETNQNGQIGTEIKEDIKQRVNELRDAIEGFNYASSALRDKLRSAVKTPFHIDPLMHITIRFDEPIAVDELVAVEIFGKHYIEITAIRVINQTIEFDFNTEDGEDSLEYNMTIYDNMNDMELWQIYLLSLIAPRIVPLLKGKIEEVNEYMDFLNKLLETLDKRGEDSE